MLIALDLRKVSYTSYWAHTPLKVFSLLMAHLFIWATLGLAPYILLSSRSILIFWILLEIASIMFIFLIQPEEERAKKEILLIYFVSQSIASVVFLVSSFGVRITAKVALQRPSRIIIFLVCLALAFKIAIAPLHQWVVKIGKRLMWKTILVLLSWQKLIPVMVLIKAPITTILALIASLRIFLGTLRQIKISSLKLIILFSSIRHLGWIIAPISLDIYLPLIYLFLYTCIFSAIALSLQKRALKSLFLQFTSLKVKEIFLLILSLRGIPPLLGFLLKWISLKALIVRITIALTFTLIACIRFYIYMRIGFKALLSESPRIISQEGVGSFKNLWAVNLIMPVALFFFWAFKLRKLVAFKAKIQRLTRT